MIITLEKRTADSVRTYYEKANRPEIKQVLPQKAKTIEEALEDAKKKYVGANPKILALPQTFKVGAVHLCMKDDDLSNV